MKNKSAQSITDAFSQIIETSKRKPNLLKTDDGKEYVNKIFKDLLNNNNIKRYSLSTDEGAVFAERFNRRIGNLLKEPVLEEGNAKYISELPSVIKHYSNTTHSSTKMTPIQASTKANEKEVYSKLQDRRVRKQPKFKLGQLVRTADTKQVFSKGGSTNWSYKLYTMTEVIHDTILSYRIDYLQEKYNETVLLPTKLSPEQNNKFMEEFHSIQ